MVIWSLERTHTSATRLVRQLIKSEERSNRVDTTNGCHHLTMMKLRCTQLSHTPQEEIARLDYFFVVTYRINFSRTKTWARSVNSTKSLSMNPSPSSAYRSCLLGPSRWLRKWERFSANCLVDLMTDFRQWQSLHNFPGVTMEKGEWKKWDTTKSWYLPFRKSNPLSEVLRRLVPEVQTRKCGPGTFSSGAEREAAERQGMAQELARRRELHQSLLKSDTKQTRDDKKGELRQLRQVQKKTRVVHAMCSFFKDKEWPKKTKTAPISPQIGHQTDVGRQKRSVLRQLCQVKKKTRVVHAMCSFFPSVSRSPYRVSMEFTFKWWTSRNKMFVMTNWGMQLAYLFMH